MCGIYGYVGPAAATADLGDAVAALAHRGPDGSGTFRSRGAAIAHTRLSIIDLAHGAQPIRAGDGITVAVNGEIYNYPELAQAFDPKEFKTRSDSEILIHVYRRDGIEGIRALRGMYAFVLIDARHPDAERVFVGRDPFGIKPLYLKRHVDSVRFASEAAVLTESAAPTVNAKARDEFFALQFSCGTETLFEGIERVPPGAVLELTGGRVRHSMTIPALPVATPRRRFEGLSALDSVLEDSVRVHQRSDVPYGLFLSGGVDSTVVMTLMARLNERPVIALTSGFPGTGVADERAAARETAARFGAIHHEVTLDEADFWTLLPEVVAALDDPVGDFATLPTLGMAKRARELGIKVVLCGEGGDELFAGYGRYRRARHRLTWQGGAGYRRRPKVPFDELFSVPVTQWRAQIASVLAQARTVASLSPLQQAQYTDVAEWLPNDLLTKLDRCLMACGVEGRTPFLDREVARFAFPLADRDKVRRGQGKYPLKAWLAAHAPHTLPFARKRFFSVPVAEWIQARGAEVGALVAASPAIAEIAAPDRVRALFTTPGKRSGFAAWLLLYYALWHRCHIEGAVFESGASASELLAAD